MPGTVAMATLGGETGCATIVAHHGADSARVATAAAARCRDSTRFTKSPGTGLRRGNGVVRSSRCAASSLRDGLSDRGDGGIDDRSDTELAGFRAGATRIAVDAVGAGEPRAVVQPIGADECGVDGERERGVGNAGMHADLVVG